MHSILSILCLALLSFILLSAPAIAEETRYPGKWEWSALHTNQIRNLTKSCRTRSDGFWELNNSGIQTRTDISGRLTAEASLHLAAAIKAFPQVIKLPPSTSRLKGVRFALTIHRTEETFLDASSNSEPEEGFSKFSTQEDGTSLAEIHLLSKWELHPGFDNNLVECIDVGLLQGHLTRLFLHLWRPDQPLPSFLAKGYESWFETYDIYKNEPRTQGIHRSDFREALQQILMAEGPLRPGLVEMLFLTEEEFNKEPELNGALADRFVHTMMASTDLQQFIHQLLAASSGTDTTKVDFKKAALVEKGWHSFLYRTLSESRPVLRADFTTKGKVPGAASVSKKGNYGNKPSLSLMPAPGGAYDLAWHGNGAIHIMQCSADGKTIAEFSPSFIQKAGALLGATRLPENKGYVVGYCIDNTHGNKNTEFWIAGFTPDGSETFNTRIFGDKNLKEVNSKGGPGGAGSARIVYNEKTKTIAFYLAHNMLWGDGVRHQGGFMGFLDERGKRKGGGNTWFYSHNFDQRLIVADGEFAALAHGDAYPRALGFSRWPGSGGKAIANQTYHNIPGESGDNTTNCQTGGLVALKNRKFAVVFASSNEREAHDICIKILDESGRTTKEKWLTNHEKGAVAAYPRIARDGDHIFVAWHEGSEMHQIVLDTKLETIVPESAHLNAKLNPYDDLHSLDNGSIVWAVPTGGNNIRVHRIEQPAVLNQALLTRNARAKRTAKPEALEQVDREMTLKLAELSADKNLPKNPIPLPSAKTPVQLTNVDKAGMLHFTSDAETKLQPASFTEFPLPDRAYLSLALLENEPENRFLYGIAGFYLECAGALEAADFYYGKSGPTAARQFANFFDES